VTGFSVKYTGLSVFLCTALQLFLSSFVLASDEERSAVATVQQGEFEHETVVVSARRLSADHIDTDFQTGHVTVISSKDFEGEVATVADVLRKEVGVQIRQRGGLGSYSSISMRGSTGAQVNVYLDGVLVNDAYGGTVDLSQFLISAVDSIEIYRGNVPVQLGEAGIGGAININTKKAAEAAHNQLTLGYGSFNSQRAAINSAGGDSSTRYLGSLEYLSSDNDYELLNNNQTENNPNDDRVERRQNAQFEQVAALLSLSHEFSDEFEGGLVAQYFDKHNGIPEVSNSPDTNASFETQNASLQLKLDQSLSSDSALGYQLYAGQRDTLYDDTQSRIGLSANLEDARTRTLGFKADYAKTIGSHLFNVGAHFKHESYLNKNLLNNTSIEVERLISSVAVQDEWLNNSGKLMVSSRVSARQYQDESKLNGAADTSEIYTDAHLGLRYQLSGSTAFMANVSRAIRVPSLYELYGDEGSATGNDKLKEEQALNTDFGFKLDAAGFEVGSVVFYRQLTDAIVMIYDSRGIGRPENISEAELWGLELDAGKGLTHWWDILLKATFQQSEDLSDIPSFQGNPLPNVYEQELSFTNTFRVMDIGITLEYERRDGGYYDRSGVAELPTSNQYHMTVDYQWLEHRVELIAKNLSDERIEDFNRFPGPGRRAFLTYSYTF
jgi:outer membrane cobalamin receptor